MNKMKKSILLILILVIFLPSETGHAFSFIPQFITHYNHHNEKHHQLSFINFVGEHFFDENHDKNHHQQDECPIKHNHTFVTLTFVLEMNVSIEFHCEINNTFIEKKTLPRYKTFFSEFQCSIWQPPKIG